MHILQHLDYLQHLFTKPTLLFHSVGSDFVVQKEKMANLLENMERLMCLELLN